MKPFLAKEYELIPQMADYARAGEDWVPYLMKCDRPNCLLPSLSTNGYGFRNTIAKDGEIIDHQEACLNGEDELGIVLGSSAVFGVGATSDSQTIPSHLNQLTSYSWLNYGGRAWNSTQELIRLLLSPPKKARKIIIFSGVNNLTLSFLASESSPVYNSFFNQSVFRAMTECPPEPIIGVRKAFGGLMRELRSKFGLGFPNKPSRYIITDSNYNNILECFERDLMALQLLSQGIGAEIYFALQPLATWVDKDLSPEEEAIFNILDEKPGDWQVLAKYMGDMRDKYFEDIEGICARKNVPYINLNDEKFESQDWLFVDRVHLTDAGYLLAAKVLKDEFNL